MLLAERKIDIRNALRGEIRDKLHKMYLAIPKSGANQPTQGNKLRMETIIEIQFSEMLKPERG